jgi:predicted transcriptional regulator
MTNVQTLVKDESGIVKLLEKEKGLFVVDIFDAPPESDIQSQISKDTHLERMKNIFNLFDDESLKEEISGENSNDVNLDHINLNGLNGRRSEMSILAFMLRTAKNGAKKTKILYEANLSGRQMKNYLSFLINSGCIEERPQRKKGILFHTTAKGNLFLFQWAKIVSLLET